MLGPSKASAHPLLVLVLLEDVGEVGRLLLLGAVGLHGLPHHSHLVLGQGVVHELQVVFSPDLAVYEHAYVECHGAHIVPLAVDEQTHAPHQSLESVGVHLHERPLELLQQGSQHFKRHFID